MRLKSTVEIDSSQTSEKDENLENVAWPEDQHFVEMFENNQSISSSVSSIKPGIGIPQSDCTAEGIVVHFEHHGHVGHDGDSGGGGDVLDGAR